MSRLFNLSRLLKTLCVLLLSGPLLMACAKDNSADASYGFTPFVEGLSQPVALENAGDGSGRLFVLEQEGLIRVIQDGVLQDTPFLDITGDTVIGSERGLLGLAFHPDYKNNGLFYINFTDANGATVIAEYSVSADPQVADVNTERILLSVPQPYGNHNGGAVVFGPDGYLYIGMGDGGSGGDPENRSQNLSELLGKILRIDVSGEPYSVPADNPFVGKDGADEIWAYGVRNPWRMSFDREQGDLYIADVGQNAFEEVSFQSAESTGGENYGWRIMEGFNCFEKGCSQEGLTLPILEYPHSEGRSITGGYVYRGEALPDLVGSYIYGDFVSGRVWLAQRSGEVWTNDLLQETGLTVSSFGEDEAGELYLVNYGGSVHRLTEK